MNELEQKPIELRDVSVDMPGARLRVAREGFHFAIEDIARNMHLRDEVIHMIESDDYDGLNRNPVFIRGYLRGYAKLVDLPADELIHSFDKLYEDAPEEKPTLEGHKHNIVSRDKPIRWISYVVIAAVISLGTLWWHNQQIPGNQSPMQTDASSRLALPTSVADKSALPHSHDTLTKSKSFVVKGRKNASKEDSALPHKPYHKEFRID